MEHSMLFERIWWTNKWRYEMSKINNRAVIFALSFLILFLIICTSLNVIADNTDFVLLTDKNNYENGEIVTITAKQKDANNITFEIDNSKGEIFLILTKDTNDAGEVNLNFNLSEKVEAGEYTIWGTAKSDERTFKKSITFIVDKLKPDLTLGEKDITFSNDMPKVGEQIRIYANIHNIGDDDSKAVVKFYDGVPNDKGILINQSQPISVLSGKSDDVFVDWTATQKGEHSIFVVIENSIPKESNLKNNIASKKIEVLPKEKMNGTGFDLPVLVIFFSGFIIAGCIASTEIGIYSLFTTFLIPLYTRIKKDDVLDHQTRGLILGFITANPGSNFNLIKNSLRLKNGTLAHHLNIMEKNNLVRLINEGSRKLVYPIGVRSPNATVILNLIIDNPGITQKEISQKTKIKQQTVNRNVKIMTDEGIVRKEKENGKKGLYFTEIEKTVFNNCPFCGKKFELHETPNYCPFCNEQLIGDKAIKEK